MIRLEPRFAELSAMTNFSFLRGASHPEEMVARAAELGLTGLGIADRNTLAGVVRAHVFARENRAAMEGMRVVSGARLVFDDGTPDMLAYPQDRAAYGRLCRLLTAGNLRAPKGECRCGSTICSSTPRACRSWRCPSIRPLFDEVADLSQAGRRACASRGERAQTGGRG